MRGLEWTEVEDLIDGLENDAHELFGNPKSIRYLDVAYRQGIDYAISVIQTLADTEEK